MHHAYIVFDNDAPLFVCIGEEHAAKVIANEKSQLHRMHIEPLERIRGTMTTMQFAQELQKAEQLMQSHFLHYHIVPYAPHNHE
jgi:hypothetical protein